MRYLLDTNICIYIINHCPAVVREHFEGVSVGDICISTITLSELQYGVAKSGSPNKNLEALRKFLVPIEVLAYDESAAEYYGRLRIYLERAGTPIGPMDLMIAAHALAARLTVVTNNLREFTRVPDLVVEDWSKKAK